MVSGNFYNPDTAMFEGEFGHLALIVRLAGQDYLADVGLGSVHQPFSPLLLVEGQTTQPGGQYRTVFSTTIGPGSTRLGSHWSRATPTILCHKEPARSIQKPNGSLVCKKTRCFSLFFYGIRMVGFYMHEKFLL